MGFLKKIINWLLNAILVVFIVASIWIFSQVFLLASFRIPSDSMEPELVEGDFVADARRTAVQPQRDAATGADRDSPRAGASGSEAGRRAGLQLPASERLGQDRDAHPEILHQTVYRIAGRHAFHPERKVPDKRHERTAREHGFAGTHRAHLAGRVSGRCL